MMILLCYDGSADAQAAIDQAGLLMAGSEATAAHWGRSSASRCQSGSSNSTSGWSRSSSGSRQAEAEREKRAKIIAAEGEALGAISFGLGLTPSGARARGSLGHAENELLGEAPQESLVGFRALGQRFVGDPDLLNQGPADFEHRRTAAIGG
jgi:hypothetical protein